MPGAFGKNVGTETGKYLKRMKNYQQKRRKSVYLKDIWLLCILAVLTFGIAGTVPAHAAQPRPDAADRMSAAVSGLPAPAAEIPETCNTLEAAVVPDTSAIAKAPEGILLDLADGEYSIECNMTGGSGKAGISSPALLTIRDGRAYVHLIWSSPHYDYMLIEGTRFENLTTDGGNSTFEIPVTVMDEGMEVIADTTAMGEPIEIRYVLTFYSDSIGDRGLVPQEAAKRVLAMALAVIIGGGILDHFVKKRRQ